MAILKRTIIFEDDLVNGTATLNLSSGEVKSIIFKNKTIEFFLNVARHAIPAANIQNNPAEFASFPPIFFAL